jgi:hypothetical protein
MAGSSESDVVVDDVDALEDVSLTPCKVFEGNSLKVMSRMKVGTDLSEIFR